jgi:hypothetical protein
MIVWAVEVLGALVSIKLADEAFGDVSFLGERCSVGALGTSPLLGDDTSGFISGFDATITGADVAVFVSWS